MISELGNEFMNADGVINYEAAVTTQNIGDQYNEMFMPADGVNDDFYNAEGDDEYYNAKGGIFGDLVSNFKKNQAKRQKRRDIRNKSKADKRVGKAKAKQTLADAQVESAKQMGKGSEADLELAKSLGKNAEQPTEKGLSKGMKIGIAVGAVVILGIVGFIVYKKMSAKKLGK